MKQFKAESKKVLDMMINSIYTHKEVFLRELISNCSDAIDKLYYKSLTDNIGGLTRNDFHIDLAADKDARTLKISDNGIGMTEKELEDNLGTIARSGSEQFKNQYKAASAKNDTVNSASAGAENGENAGAESTENIGTENAAEADKTAGEQKESAANETVAPGSDINIIGQFGVGFYSAFMVADKVSVLSKAYGADKAYLWESTGEEGYTITPAEKDSYGTEITLTLKQNADGENYDRFLEEYTLRELVKKYSDYIRYPIRMICKNYKTEDGKEVAFDELTTLNSMVPLWKKNKAEITQEEYDRFYEENFYDYHPLKVIQTAAEGAVDYRALLFIPSNLPYNYYSKSYEKGLKLYTNGVLITDRCEELLPDYFGFVKGVVDCELKLNVSRESIHESRDLKAIAQNIEKKIRNELASMLKNDRETYEKFFDTFGLQLKYGVYQDFGMHAETLKDLLLFKSVKENKYVTLKEYRDAMTDEQKYIYYCPGKTAEAVKALPAAGKVLESGFDVLLFTDDVDEFAVKILRTYEEKEFRSVTSEDVGLGEETMSEEETALASRVKEALKDAVNDVRFTHRLKDYPVCLTSTGDISIGMEKTLNAMPDVSDKKISATKVLEVNADHKVFEKLKAYDAEEDKTAFNELAEVLYAQARLTEGLAVDDIAAYTKKVCDLLAR